MAKNVGIVKYLADLLQTEIHQLPEDSQIVGAIGAAIAAKEEIA